MLTRNEYFYTKEALGRAEQAVLDYKATNPEYVTWVKWTKMDDSDKEKLEMDWTAYYEKVKQSPSYLGYQKMKNIFQFKRFDSEGERNQTLKDLAKEARERREAGVYLPKPSSVDPNVVRIYGAKIKEMEEKLEIMRKQIEEHKNVYEKQNTGEDL